MARTKSREPRSIPLCPDRQRLADSDPEFQPSRGNRWWLDGFAYVGLMALAYVRIAMYRLKAAASR